MRPLVVAHRGASAYLPESSIPAKALAVAQGADYVEHDIVMTKDDHLLINHDLWLEGQSDVALKFPGRDRADGHYYAIDFTLDEILTLSKTEPFSVIDGIEVANYPGRHPLWLSTFGFHTLDSELQLLRGLHRSMGREVGIFTELKSPWFHEREGKDLSSAVYDALARNGYRTREDRCRVMSFDANALERIRTEVAPAHGVDVPLTQLITHTDGHETYERLPDGNWGNYSYDWMFEPEAMERIALYADGIGPDLRMLIDPTSTIGDIRFTRMARDAHDAGLYVTPWTARADDLPPYAAHINELFEALLVESGVEGIITDFPDLGVKFVDDLALRN